MRKGHLLSVVDIFLDLVKINSPSFNERQAATYVTKYLEELGLEVHEDDANKHFAGNSGNIIANLSSQRQAPTIFLDAHLDTVEPCLNVKPNLVNGIIRSDGKTVLGGDDKAGVAIILEVARIIVKEQRDHGPMQLVFTVAEEKGLWGSKNLDFSRIDANYAFVLDAEGDAGGLIVKAPSQNSIKAVFEGKSAHAGVNPEQGINAILAASKACSYMKMGRRDFETTSNIGVIHGGIAPNIVPPEAVIEGEARSHSLEKLETETEQIRQCIRKAAKEVGAVATVDVLRAFDAFSLTEQDDVVVIATKAIESAGLKPALHASGGGSDANVFNKAGIPAVNISVGEEAVHSVEERVAVRDLEASVQIVLHIVNEIVQRV